MWSVWCGKHWLQSATRIGRLRHDLDLLYCCGRTDQQVYRDRSRGIRQSDCCYGEGIVLSRDQMVAAVQLRARWFDRNIEMSRYARGHAMLRHFGRAMSPGRFKLGNGKHQEISPCKTNSWDDLGYLFFHESRTSGLPY